MFWRKNVGTQSATQQWALYIANLMHRESHGVIKVVRYKINILCLPDAHPVELVEKQIARQTQREMDMEDLDPEITIF